MTFTDKQLKFIEEHSEDIESGDLDRIIKALAGTSMFSSDKRNLTLALVYIINGPNSFKLRIQAKSPDLTLEGVVKSRLNISVSGVPLLPAMFGKTKLKLYKIENNKITQQKDYKLVGLSQLNEEMANYNLAVLDKPQYTELVDKKFNGTLVYTGYLIYADDIPNIAGDTILYKGIETAEEQKVKSLLREPLIEDLTNKLNQEIAETIIDLTMKSAQIEGV